MIPFRAPQISMLLSEYMELVQLQEQAGNCAGFFISLGDEFFKSGVSEVDRVITPTLRDRAVNPSRVSYRIFRKGGETI